MQLTCIIPGIASVDMHVEEKVRAQLESHPLHIFMMR